MAEAYIYDAVRTPRGKGKSNGSLHEQTSLQLATQVLQAIRDRNNLDTSKVDDVYMGVLSPIGEQGGNLPRIAVLNAGYAETVAGVQVDVRARRDRCAARRLRGLAALCVLGFCGH